MIKQEIPVSIGFDHTSQIGWLVLAGEQERIQQVARSLSLGYTRLEVAYSRDGHDVTLHEVSLIPMRAKDNARDVAQDALYGIWIGKRRDNPDSIQATGWLTTDRAVHDVLTWRDVRVAAAVRTNMISIYHWPKTDLVVAIIGKDGQPQFLEAEES